MPDMKKLPHLAAPAAPPPPGAVYQDDEPLERHVAAASAAAAQKAPAANGGLVLNTLPEFPALGRAASRDRFAVLVHAPAPADVARSPLDLVTVLDVSSSMMGPKLDLLKQAMSFLIDQLGPADRLSVVSFSTRAWRLTRLARMSPAGKATAKRVVDALAPLGGTNIGDGLRVAAQVLAGRRHKNPVAAVILLSDGRDTFLVAASLEKRIMNLVPRSLANALFLDWRGRGLAPPNGGGARSHMDLVPPSFVNAASRPAPIHTFGFGIGHDATGMHAIAEATGGTFSFVQDVAVIQDSFALCVGGLLSVAVQGARVAVTCLHRGVRVQEVKSGSYASHVGADGRSATVDAGELYDGEERRFLVLVYVPKARATEEVTRLLKASCTYRVTATGQAARAAAPAVVIQRPLELTHMPPPAMEVERERVRLAARVAADGGQHAGAAKILNSRLREVERSAPGAAGDDPTCEALKEELRDLSARVGDRREYQQTGRACLLAGMSSHAQQRATGVELQSPTCAPRAYLTPKMEEMVEISRESSRKRGSNTQQPGGTSRQVKQIKEDLSEIIL